MKMRALLRYRQIPHAMRSRKAYALLSDLARAEVNPLLDQHGYLEVLRG